MNHACLTYVENGRRKIMVAGGVVKTESGQNDVTNTVEVLDWSTKLWKFDRATPRRMTGFKLISVSQRPTIIGRYDNEYQNVILRHTLATQTWDPLPVTLPAGKSDFAVLKLPNKPDIGRYMLPTM